VFTSIEKQAEGSPNFATSKNTKGRGHTYYQHPLQRKNKKGKERGKIRATGGKGHEKWTLTRTTGI